MNIKMYFNHPVVSSVHSCLGPKQVCAAVMSSLIMISETVNNNNTNTMYQAVLKAYIHTYICLAFEDKTQLRFKKHIDLR